MEMEARPRKVRPNTPTPDYLNCLCYGSPARTLKEVIDRAMINSLELFHPVRILKSEKATVVFWKDGTKTVVKCAPGTTPNDYDAFTAALAIKIFGNNSALKKVIQRSTVVQAPKAKKRSAER